MRSKLFALILVNLTFFTPLAHAVSVSSVYAVSLETPQEEEAYSHFCQAGKFSVQEGKEKEAIDAFTKAILLDPNKFVYWACRACTYSVIENYPGAIIDATRAIELAPGEEGVYYTRGMAYDSMGEEDASIKDLLTAARLGSECAQDMLRWKGISW